MGSASAGIWSRARNRARPIVPAADFVDHVSERPAALPRENQVGHRMRRELGRHDPGDARRLQRFDGLGLRPQHRRVGGIRGEFHGHRGAVDAPTSLPDLAELRPDDELLEFHVRDYCIMKVHSGCPRRFL